MRIVHPEAVQTAAEAVDYWFILHQGKVALERLQLARHSKGGSKVGGFYHHKEKKWSVFCQVVGLDLIQSVHGLIDDIISCKSFPTPDFAFMEKMQLFPGTALIICFDAL